MGLPAYTRCATSGVEAMGKKEAIVHEFPKTRKSELKLGTLQQKLEQARSELTLADLEFSTAMLRQKNAQLEYDRALGAFKDATRSFLKEVGE